MTNPTMRHHRALSSLPCLLAVLLSSSPGTAQQWDQPRVSTTAASGTAATFADLDGDGVQDVVLAALENGPAGPRLTWRVGLHVDGSGTPTGGWHDHAAAVPNGSATGFGVGIAVGELDGSGGPELIVGYIGAVPNGSLFLWVGHDLQPDGSVVSWTNPVAVAGGAYGGGFGLALGQFGGGFRPDLVLVRTNVLPDPQGFVYWLLRDLAPNGDPLQGPSPRSIVPELHGDAGADVAVTSLDDDPRPEIVVATVESVDGRDTCRWRIGWNVNFNGTLAQWTELADEVALAGGDGGLGLALGDWNADGRRDALLVTEAPDPATGLRRWRARALGGAIGRFSPFGSGCALLPGVDETVPQLALLPGVLPQHGVPIDVMAAGVDPATTFGILVVDFGPPIAPLPLAMLGRPDCQLLVDPLALLLMLPGPSGLTVSLRRFTTDATMRLQGVFLKDGVFSTSEGRDFALGRAAPRQRIYDVDFSSPLHVVDAAPTVGAGPTLPRRTVASILAGTPTVRAAVGELIDQPCELDSPTYLYQQLGFNAFPVADNYRIECRAQRDPGGTGPLTFLLDTPQIRRVDFGGDGGVRIYLPADGMITIGSYTPGVAFDLCIEVDLRHSRWQVHVDGVLLHDGPFGGAQSLQQVRVHVSGAHAAIDDLVISTAPPL